MSDNLLTVDRVAIANGWVYCEAIGRLLKSINETPVEVMTTRVFCPSAIKRGL